jgi:hypothetical protein
MIRKFLLTICLLLAVVSEATAADENRIFKCEPYLQQPVDSGITVTWVTAVPTYSWIEYGTDAQHLVPMHLTWNGIIEANDLIHRFRLSHLQPGQKYYYRVCSREITKYEAYNKQFGPTATSPVHSFTLPKTSDTDFTMIIYNDLHDRMATYDQLAALVKDVPRDFTIFNGDCLADIDSAAEGLRLIAHMNEGAQAADVPVLYLRGNHETRNQFSLLLRQYVDFVGDKSYQAFNWGDTRFVVYDCGEDKSDDHKEYFGLDDFAAFRQAETVFLRHELHSKAFRKAKCRVLIGHVPLFGNTDDYQPCRDAWLPFLAKASFNIAIGAHIHAYTYQPADSVHAYPVVTGGGPSTNVKDEDVATVMVLQKRGRQLSLRVIRADGTELLKL